jgi:hypothetical protein
VSNVSDRTLILKILAEKIGVKKVDQSACTFEALDSGRLWRVRVMGNGDPLRYESSAHPDETVTFRDIVVTEREITAADRATVSA